MYQNNNFLLFIVLCVFSKIYPKETERSSINMFDSFLMTRSCTTIERAEKARPCTANHAASGSGWSSSTRLQGGSRPADLLPLGRQEWGAVG